MDRLLFLNDCAAKLEETFGGYRRTIPIDVFQTTLLVYKELALC